MFTHSYLLCYHERDTVSKHHKPWYIIQSWHGCRNKMVMKTGRKWLLVESSKPQDYR